MPRFVLLVILLAVLSAAPAVRPAAAQPPPAAAVGADAVGSSAVLAVVDGTPATLRLFGVQTPPRGDALGEQAAALVRTIVVDQPLLLERCVDLVAPDGAPLWNVTTLDDAGNQVAWVNGLLVAAGLARVPDAAAATSSCYAGDLLELQVEAQDAGIAIWQASNGVLADTTAVSSRAHDWRAPGFVAAVGGGLYDAQCVPLQSSGANVPNLLFHPGLPEQLEWMRIHRMRWMRVFATTHGNHPDLLPQNVGAVIARLHDLLAQVEAFNIAHDPSERIYVLVALTDYYPPGVPGDRFAYDHPTFSESPVLPAPWYRAGSAGFSFDQEHGYGMATGMPNYQITYRPWVRAIVASASTSPALMGWQLGNELKARNSPRNDISASDAYSWYLDFTRDVVDLIRAQDRNHLIFMGAQYMAELVDWDYRGANGDPILDRIPTYQSVVQEAMNACTAHCWNVWGLTGYDFNPFAIDDATLMGQAGIASVMTEYGFTRGTVAEMQQRYRADQAAAVRDGVNLPWRDVDGNLIARSWGVPELLQRTGLAGVAAWGAPVPGPNAGPDADRSRGVTGVPDEASLWVAWGDVGTRLEAANRAAGPSSTCLGYQSVP